jgi:hypothetical protein
MRSIADGHRQRRHERDAGDRPRPYRGKAARNQEDQHRHEPRAAARHADEPVREQADGAVRLRKAERAA